MNDQYRPQDDTHPLGRVPQPATPPPAYDPYGNPYRDAYAAQQTAPQVHRTGWSWRSSLVGAVAGGVIAASVAVPVSWTLAQDGAEPTAADPPAAIVPEQPGPGGAWGEGLPGGRPDGRQGGSTGSQEGQQSEASAKQSQGVVLIDTSTVAGEAAGTGLVLDSSGLVLTNYHVVEGSSSVSVTVAATGETYDATVVGHDQRADVALLQLEDASDLATVDLDDDGDPAVSDEVTAIGNAQGQGFLSASTGSVVALEQSIDTESEGAVQGEHLTGLIQTDAYVVGGYSGGPLLDDEGEVVGITTAAASGGATQSYAVPIEDALAISQQIEDGKESDGVQVGPSAYLGVSISNASGRVEVGQVQNGGAAAAAGVEAGSVITGLDATAITTYDELRTALASYEPGDSVTLRWRDVSGADHSERVTLGESPVN